MNRHRIFTRGRVTVIIALSMIIYLSIILSRDDSNLRGTDRSKEVKRSYIGTLRHSDVFVDGNDDLVGIDTSITYRTRIEDLRSIKLSINNELRILERERIRLLRESTLLTNKNERLASMIERNKSLLKQLELDVTANRRRLSEKNCDRQTSFIPFKPLKSENIEDYSNPSMTIIQSSIENLNYSFNFQRCPLAKEFKFFLHISDELDPQTELRYLENLLETHSSYTQDRNDACLVISFVDGKNEKSIAKNLNRNESNLVIDIDGKVNTKEIHGKAAIASPYFSNGLFRRGFDIVIPNLRRKTNSDVMGMIPPFSPIKRKYLASYFGMSKPRHRDNSSVLHVSSLIRLENVLRTIHQNSVDDLFLFIYECGPGDLPCFDEREKLIELSTFTIILPPSSAYIDPELNDLIYMSLSRGSIPVIIGKNHIRLPFDEVIDWRRASLLLPTERISELHLLLRSIADFDIYNMKQHGRRIFERHLASTEQSLETLIAIMRIERFNQPPEPINNIPTITFPLLARPINDSQISCSSNTCNEISIDSNMTNTLPGLLEPELLGPREAPLVSPSFRRNLSLVFNSGYDLWNNQRYMAIKLFPSLPTDPISPSEYKFLSDDRTFRPIAGGLGGSGAEFSRDLGGDMPYEQFTVIILTYERNQLLMKTLDRLKGMPYVNKYLIIWNSVNYSPPMDLPLPDMGSPIKIVQVTRNSLNNRFLPFDEIETDAILSLDDDTPLRQDEIIFAFRVWRESRDRIVGFPGRFHAWDGIENSWLYNSNHSCELSMVLTGGAFYHRYYSYLYTYEMPEAIRSIVDRFMNCEDIAMNFLVAHITRKPPIKVTSRWTFHCSGCPSSLSNDETHFHERHECLNNFASIYGYMPLINTQHRADSVLFKTRLPIDKQKCFRFV